MNKCGCPTDQHIIGCPVGVAKHALWIIQQYEKFDADMPFSISDSFDRSITPETIEEMNVLLNELPSMIEILMEAQKTHEQRIKEIYDHFVSSSGHCLMCHGDNHKHGEKCWVKNVAPQC
jgi:hypothetical protein